MYKSGGILMLFGVIISVAVIAGIVWYVNNQIPKHLKKREWLTRYVALILAALLGVFIVDMLVSWDVQLMNDSMRHDLFDLIKNIVLVVFGYQFASNQSNNQDENNQDRESGN
jgi:uncharacterized protein YacL